MKDLILVFIGSGFGGVARFLVGKNIFVDYFPLSTLVANILACFILGLTIGLAQHRQLISADVKLFVTIGFCGGFSTFSTFSNDTLQLLQAGNYTLAAANIILSVVLSIGATLGGLMVFGQNH